MKVKRTYVALYCLALSLGAMAQKPLSSDGTSTSWYNIVSESADAKGLVMSDNSGQTSSLPIALLTDDGSTAMQWKLVEDDSNGLIRFVNRKTGSIIQPVSVAEQLYNVTQLSSSVLTGKGFTLEELGNGQYALPGEEADGTTRYLISAKEGTAPATATSATAGSAFAWSFRLVETVGINTVEKAQPSISVVDGRITVTPAVPFRITTVDGVTMKGNGRLPVGVYLVTVEGETVKIIVNK